MDYRLDALALALSQHYRLLKEMIGVRRGTPVIPSRVDAETADKISDIIARIGGKGLSNYFRLKFREGYLSGEHEIYDIREMLTEVSGLCNNRALASELNERLDELTSLVYRLSNPATRKTAEPHRNRKIKEAGFTQELLFPEVEEIADEDTEVRPVRASSDKVKKTRKTKIDRLAEEIIRDEYGEDNNDEYDDQDEEYEDYDEEVTFGEVRHYDDYTGICDED